MAREESNLDGSFRYSRAAAMFALVLTVFAWLLVAYVVWFVSLLIFGFRHDGIADGDRTFLALAPAAAFFIAPMVLTYLGLLVIWRRRSGWPTFLWSLAAGGTVSVVATAAILYLGWDA